MNPRPSRFAAAAVTAALLGLGAVACSGEGATGSAAPAANSQASAPGAGGAAASNRASAPSARPVTPVVAHPGSRGATGTPAAADRCHTGELRADVQLQPDRPGSAMVMLVNKGSRTCTVHGYLGYGGLLADNSRVDVATARVPYPGPPVQVVLKPGTTAFSGLSFSTCDKADPKCTVLAGLVVTPPDETTQLTAQVLGVDGQPVPQLPVSAAGLRVGSLQPSNQGVLLP
ncbi:DUF4232 domain-containing protein [Kitasatospora sp. NPDC056138]|uniref:DUF4232 domain-containing protein n=1 Tax=Kitasatospora sp. NPDC056138 TaxID=3345724 RepID=UPI0035DC544A